MTSFLEKNCKKRKSLQSKPNYNKGEMLTTKSDPCTPFLANTYASTDSFKGKKKGLETHP